MKYREKLEDPRWQRLRLEKMAEQDFTCEICNDRDEQLEVHHKKYKDVPDPERSQMHIITRPADPWEYELSELMCLCHTCHTLVHMDEYKVADFAQTCLGSIKFTPATAVDIYSIKPT